MLDVGSRLKEFAIRSALGATPLRLLEVVVSRALRLMGWGLLVGLLAAL